MGEAGGADTAGAEVYRVELNELIKPMKLPYFGALYNKTQASKDEQVIRGKKMSKERISALCCASADGMYRHKLVVFGK